MSKTLEEVQANIARQVRNTDCLKGKSIDTLKDMFMHGLTEEAGEVAGLRKRELRGLPKDLKRADKQHFIEELGDTFWYLTALCSLYQIDLDLLWENNLIKLHERYPEGVATDD